MSYETRRGAHCIYMHSVVVLVNLLQLARTVDAQCQQRLIEMQLSSVMLEVPYSVVSTKYVASTLPTGPMFGPLPLTLANNTQRRTQVSAVVGSTIFVNFTAKWPGSSELFSLYALEDPGVPNVQDPSSEGVRPQTCAATGACTMPFIWSPYKGQEGLVHTLCVLAIPTSTKSCQSSPLCIDIKVELPNITFNASVTPANGQPFHSPVGCILEVCFEAYDVSMLYAVDLAMVPGTLPPGGQFDLQCAQVPSPAPPPYPLFSTSAQGTPSLLSPLPCRRCLRWEAKRGSETSSYRPCVAAFDQSSAGGGIAGALRSTATCVAVTVPKCKYCVQAGDTLHYINKKYHLNTNWLQLWNANGMPEIAPDPLAPAVVIPDPDWIADGNAIINLGPLYAVQPGDTLPALAAMFRTTVRKLLDVNPDLAAPQDLRPAASLCVMPCTDAPFVFNDNPEAA